MQTGGSRANTTTNSPLVSIICVTFNAAKTLPGFLSCIAQKKVKGIEIIIIDGKSTDNTVHILEEYNPVIDFWLSEPDNGIYDAMNKAVNYAKGNWLIFFGADDLLADDFTKALPFLKHPNAIYYGKVNYYGKEFAKIYTDYYLTKLNICHQTIFYPKTVFDKYKYDLRYNVYADYHLNLRCWKDPVFNFIHVGFLIAHFGNGGFSTFTKDPLFESERDLLFKKYLKPLSYYRYLNRTIGFWAMLNRFVQNR